MHVPARSRLLAEREATLQRLADLSDDFAQVVTASYDSNADDEHDPEGATVAFERAQIDALIGAARDQLTEVDAAVQRLDAGTYGACESCGQQIASPRLDARPTARTCVGCPVPRPRR